MTQNLSSYWIFYTVANAGNISKAAKELYISQPAISKSIQKLEESLNCKLFSRSSRGVLLTDEGALLYDHVKEAFETLNLGEDKLKRSIELGVGRIQIGVSTTLCKHILLPYLTEFVHQNPHISISINCQSTHETLRLLEENKIEDYDIKTRILNDQEYTDELNKKLQEEVKEYLADNNVEELADIVEVIYGILSSMEVSIEEFESIRKLKVDKRGAFKNRIFLEDAE